MAIENERKLLLDALRCDQLLKELQQQPDVMFYDITQGYLNGSCRIRHVVPHVNPTTQEQFVFTFKTKVRGGDCYCRLS